MKTLIWDVEVWGDSRKVEGSSFKAFGKSSKKQEMLEIEEQNCDDTLGNEEREC